jgi:hypothetical protein
MAKDQHEIEIEWADDQEEVLIETGVRALASVLQTGYHLKAV